MPLLTATRISITCDPGLNYEGLAWHEGFDHSAKFADTNEAPAAYSVMAALMPTAGETREDVADIFLRAHNRVTELVAGAVGEGLFVEGVPWIATDDLYQARACASMITSSAESAEAFISFCRVEAAELLRAHADIVHALAAELAVKRTMAGVDVDLIIAATVAARAILAEHERRVNWKTVLANSSTFQPI